MSKNPKKDEQARLLFTVLVLSLFTGFLGGVLSVQFLEPSEGGVFPSIIKRESTEKEAATKEIATKEEQIVRVVEEASPAVVSVIVTKNLPVIEKFFINPFGDNPFFRIPQFRQKGTEKQQVGGGSGFIISDDGLIITNKHVVADTEADYTVLTNKGEKFQAEVLARDPVLDLAVLKINVSGLPTVRVGDSGNLKIGQSVIAIGNALGEFRNTVSVGVVSGLSRNITAAGGGGGVEQLEDIIQTDAAINPGNSGGPLLNIKGEVIGINTARVQGAQNIGFAIPINQAKKDINDVKTKGKIVYPFLGVRYVMVNEAIQKQNDLTVDYGAFLVAGDEDQPAVTPDSPAEEAGLQAGDIILEVDGERVTEKNNLAKLIQKHAIGDEITIKILRDDQELLLKVILAER